MVIDDDRGQHGAGQSGAARRGRAPASPTEKVTAEDNNRRPATNWRRRCLDGIPSASARVGHEQIAPISLDGDPDGASAGLIPRASADRRNCSSSLSALLGQISYSRARGPLVQCPPANRIRGIFARRRQGHERRRPSPAMPRAATEENGPGAPQRPCRNADRSGSRSRRCRRWRPAAAGSQPM